MGSGLILPDTPEIREYVKKRDAEIRAARGDSPSLQESAKEKLESNAEFQARSRMSKDEKIIDAVERQARARQVYYEKVHGVYRSIEQCKAELADIHRKFARDNGIE